MLDMHFLPGDVGGAVELQLCLIQGSKENTKKIEEIF